MIKDVRGKLSYMVAVGASALALSVLLLVGGAAFVAMSAQLRDHARTQVEGEARLRAHKLADVLDDMVIAVGKLSESWALTRGAAPLPPEFLDVHGVGVSIALTDAGGIHLSGPRSQVGSGDSVAVAALAAGRPVSRIVDVVGGAELVVALPVIATGSGSPTAALVCRMRLADLARRLWSPSAAVAASALVFRQDEREQEIVLGSNAPKDAVERIEALVPMRVPALLDVHQFTLRATAPDELLAAPLGRLATTFLVIASLGAVTVVVLATVIGHRLTGPLSRLAASAASYCPGEGAPATFASGETEEIATLGRAFAAIIERLNQAFRDIERRSQTLLSNAERLAHVGSTIWEFPGNSHQWSDEFHAVLGLEPGDCVPSTEVLLDRVHPADRPRVLAALELAASDGRTIIEDFRVIRPDGEVRVVHGRGEVVLNAEGKPLRLNGAIQDITERKQLEDRLDALVRELRRSNEELEEFAYVCSHDLRQPLRAVGSYVALLEEDLAPHLTGETREFVTFARDGVRRMDRLITDLLAYSRVGRTAKDGPVDVAGELCGAIADLQVEIDEANASLVVPATLPVVMGDRSEMARLFQNLLGNALKYRHPDALPMVEFSCEAVGQEWWFALADNGIGIPPEHSERIFGIFQRLHARDEYEGTGVGLAICRKIVERHGGRIWADATTTSGAVVRFTWPKT
ncbi:MAG: PAS domain-containing protein [Magnetospirillum sp.]|nr:PAS domain-containing protein [Magnetospirillum sp.]